MIRRYGEPVVNDQRYKVRPGAYAILPKGRQILLTHQMEPNPEFQLPGGGIDPGESAITALHREVFEETGWRIGYIRRVTTYRRFVYMPEYDMWAEKLCHIFVARPIRPHSPPTEPGHTALWAGFEVAKTLLESPGDQAVLANWLNG